MKKIKLFFSGDLSDESALQEFCRQKNWQLTAHSLLQFKAVPFTIQQDFDVVFISSIRSFNYFSSQYSDLKSIHYAVIGHSTTKKMNVEKSSIAFIGEKSGDPEKVATDFKSWLGERRVLFPLSTRSQETIAQQITDHQKEIVYCYETQLLKKVVEPADVYVFTSPSNVEAFLLKNELPVSALVASWGTTTKNKLVEIGCDPQIVLEQSTEDALVEALGKWASAIQ